MKIQKTCPICETGKLTFIEKKRNVNGDIDDMYACNVCFVIVNMSRNKENLGRQEVGLRCVYKYSEEDVRNIRDHIAEQKKLLTECVMPFISKKINGKVLLEIGCGRGLLMIAAVEMGFGKALGVDISPVMFDETKNHIAVSNNVLFYRNIADIRDRADCVVMWHTLEHIFDPNLLLRELRPKLNDGCRFVLQVPQYRQEHVCDTHHFFYNEPSMRHLFKRNGMTVTDIVYDFTNQFMTVAATAFKKKCFFNVF